MTNGYTGVLDTVLAYRRTTGTSSLLLSPSGTVITYPGNMDGPAAGGMFDLDGWVWARRNLRLGMSEIIRYRPVFSIGALEMDEVLSQPLADTAQGLYRRASWDFTTNFDVDNRWGRRDSTLLSYTYYVKNYTADDYGNTREHRFWATYRHVFAEALRMRAEYRYIGRDRTSSEGGVLGMTDHRIEAGPEIHVSLSRSRYLRLSAGAGAAYLESYGSTDLQRYATWVPVGSANATLGLSSSGSIQAGYRRDFSTLAGVTDEVYMRDNAYLSGVAGVAPRTSLLLSATYTNSKTPRVSGAGDTFNVYGASLGVSVAMTERMAATVGYYFYRHHYSDPAALAEGFPATYDRHAVRAGFSLRIPLAGAEHQWGLGR